VAKTDSSGNVVSNVTFQMGDNDIPAAAAVDPLGNLWIAGSAPSPTNQDGLTVGLIAEVDSTGTRLVFTGTFGGLDPTGWSAISAIAFDPAGNLYVAGSTTQLDFPVTPGAFIGAIPFVAAGQELSYGFVAKLTPANQATPPYTVAYSTLLGGPQVFDPLPCPNGESCAPSIPTTFLSALAVNASGEATVSGVTTAGDFPVTPGAFQTQFQSDGIYNNPDVFVTRLNNRGTGLIWSTLVGETNYTPAATVGGIALDSSGNVVLTGVNSDPNFPIASGAIQPQLAGAQDGSAAPSNGFVTKLDSKGAKLLFSTYYGIVSGVVPPVLRLDAQGDIWITESLAGTSGLVLHPNSLVLGDNLIGEIAPDGSGVLFSELLPNGMAAQDLALNPDGSLTVTGSGGFVLRQPRATPTGVSVLGVADSAANSATKTVAPGEYVSIYGTGLGPRAGVGMQLDASGRVASSLGGTQVSIGGVLAPLIYASENQINLLAPYEIRDSAQVNMTIATNAGSSQTLPLQVVAAQPNIFAVLNSDGSSNSASNPAAPGDTVSILISGAGAINPPLPDGTIATSPAPAPAIDIQVSFSYLVFQIFGFGVYGRTVTPAYAGGMQGTAIDMLRVDAQVPADLDCSYGCSIGVELGNSYDAATAFHLAAPRR
jgi:uncharacterized protein (TIGR03437 family)